jgi:chromate transporter
MLVLQVLALFSLLSVLAVGGGAAVIPEMKALTVGPAPWLTADQFGQFYSLGQLAPGPNMLMVSVIGYHVAGYPGALAALLGFFVPAGVITFFAGRLWDRFAGSPWRTALAHGLGPMTIGLMLAGIVSIERSVMEGEGWLPYAIAAAVALILPRVKINPIVLILAGGLVTWLAR